MMLLEGVKVCLYTDSLLNLISFYFYMNCLYGYGTSKGKLDISDNTWWDDNNLYI